MCAQKRSGRVPENINEEYYQINSDILSSFPKYRPPVDLFFFNEEIAVLAPFSRKGARLTNEQVEEAARLCHEGMLFVSRSDHHIYSEHIVKQLDLVLQDHNLKEAEIVNICLQALKNRYNEFANQPVKSVFEPLYNDILVVTEYLMRDKTNINAFMRRLSNDHASASHAINTMSIGLWLWFKTVEEINRKDLANLATGLLTHDIGMSKIPQFFLTRPGPLKNEEREKILLHPLQSAKIMQKMDLSANEVLQACFEHHERLDGSGYPQKLKANQIKQISRIVAIADSFSAMISKRPWSEPKSFMDAANELATLPGYDNSLGRLLVAAYATGKF